MLPKLLFMCVSMKQKGQATIELLSSPVFGYFSAKAENPRCIRIIAICSYLVRIKYDIYTYN